MDSLRIHILAILWIWITNQHFCSGSSPVSLWGQKANLMGQPCYWQLSGHCSVPDLEALTACVTVQREVGTSEWTGFDYKQRGQLGVELGLTGTRTQLRVWLFGREHQVNLTENYPLHQWHTVCLTWSAKSGHLRLYTNGNRSAEVRVNGSHLAGKGMLTLGVSHTMLDGVMNYETGKELMGFATLFRMWGRELGVRELKELRCVDGDVVSWTQLHWDLKGTYCQPLSDPGLTCEWTKYKIDMNVTVKYKPKDKGKLTTIVQQWFEHVFHSNFSVYDIFISSPRQGMGDDSESDEEIKGRSTSSGTTEHRFACLVYVEVTPIADVSVVQNEVYGRLRSKHYHDSVEVKADQGSIMVISIEAFPNVTEPQPTGATAPPNTTTTATTTTPTTTTTTITSTTTTATPMITITTTTTTTPTTTAATTTTTTTTAATTADTTANLPICPAMAVVGSPSATIAPEECRPDDPGKFRQDTIYRVSLNASISMPIPIRSAESIEKWLNTTLSPERMTVLNFEMETELHIHGCTFQVQAKSLNVNETMDSIKRLLTDIYTSGNLSIQAKPDQINITHIDPGFCPDNLQQTLYGLYDWPRTEPEDKAILLCEKNSRDRATRFCKLDGKTDRSKWEQPDLSLCERTLTDINDLENVTVTANNSGEIVDMIDGLVGNGSDLSDSQLDTVLDKLGEVVDVSPVSPGVAEIIVEIISDVLQSTADLASFTNKILGLTDSVGDTMNFTGEAHGMTAPSLALQLVSVNASRFLGLTFGVSSFTSNNSPEIFMNETFVERPHGAVAAISLPSVLESFFPRNNTNNTRPRIQFQFYDSTVLFKNPTDTMKLNSYVVSASMTNANVSNLQQPIIITLRHLNSVKGKDQSVQCVYWDFTKSGGGGWESRGCKVKSECSDAFQTTCHCDHLTHFGVLLDISKEEISAEDEAILTIISYLGCGLSSIFLGITLLTYVAFEKLRQDYPSKILINLSLALLGLNLVFLVNSWFSSLGSRGVCVGVAATQHFFVLASFTWMGLEALHMYFALVKVFNTYVPSYMLKFCLLGWGIPAAIIILVLAIDTNIYGSAVDDDPSKDPLKDSSPFCWVQDETAFYVSVMAFILLVLLCNIAVFGVVLVQIRRMQANKASSNSSGLMHDLRVVASLTFLLGLTWILPFFGWGPLHTPFMYLFSILNSLQGFFIFIFYCLMKENVQKQWRLHLCCGPLRPGDYSEWSRSMTGAGRGGHSRLVNFPSIKTEDTSSMRKISDSSASGASQIHA